MKKFESVLIINNKLTEGERDLIISKIEQNIEKIGKITDKNIIGERKLAYEIKNNKQGYYISYQFEIDNNIQKCADCIRDFEKFLKTQEEIIRFIIVDL